MNQAQQLVRATPQHCHRGLPTVDGRRDRYVRCCRLSHENARDLRLECSVLINLCIVANLARGTKANTSADDGAHL